MILNIILEDKKTEDIGELLEDIHNILAGNKDYVDSNIVLSDRSDNTSQKEITLYFSKDDCQNKEYIREKAKVAVNMFIDQ